MKKRTIKIDGKLYRVERYEYSCTTHAACEEQGRAFSDDIPAEATGDGWAAVAKVAGFEPDDEECGGASVSGEAVEIFGLSLPAGTILVSGQYADGCPFALLIPA